MLSLRLRLTMVMGLISALVLVSSWALIRSFRQDALRSEFDGRLVTHARELAQRLGADTHDPTGSRVRNWHASLAACGFQFQILGPRGEAQGPAFEAPVPFPFAGDDPAAPTTRAPHVAVVRPESGESKAAGLRVATVPYPAGEAPSGFLQLLESTQPLDTALARIDGFVLWLWLPAVLILALSCWWLAGRITKPVLEIAAAAGAVSATTLHERIQVHARDSEILRLKTSLNSALTSIEEGYRAQSRFVGNIAHELKTPLALALSQAELMQRASSDRAAVEHYATSIAADMHHLSEVVESFLRLARSSGTEDRSQHEPVYVNDVVVEAIRRAQPLATAGDVSLVTTLDYAQNDDALQVHGDARLLETMFENLVRFAIRRSPRGGRVDLRVASEEESVVLRVGDHGPDIPTEHLGSIFDWFFKLPSGAPPGGGTGIGLAIARRIAEHHLGAIMASNRGTAGEPSGSELEVRLPRWRAPDRARNGGMTANAPG